MLAALPAIIRREEDRMAYQVYMTDAFKAAVGASTRYWDIIERKPVDDRSGDEICQELTEKFGLGR